MDNDNRQFVDASTLDDNKETQNTNPYGQPVNDAFGTPPAAPVSPVYGTPNYTSAPQPQNDNEVPVSMGDWIGTMLLMLVPCVNIVLLFVWAFSKTEKKSKSNWAKAQLIIVAIVTALSIVLSSVLASTLYALMTKLNY